MDLIRKVCDIDVIITSVKIVVNITTWKYFSIRDEKRQQCCAYSFAMAWGLHFLFNHRYSTMPFPTHHAELCCDLN